MFLQKLCRYSALSPEAPQQRTKGFVHNLAELSQDLWEDQCGYGHVPTHDRLARSRLKLASTLTHSHKIQLSWNSR